MNKLIELIDAEPFVYGINFKNKVNLTVYEGEHPTIVGSNGAGKTKLAEMIAGKVIVRSGVMRLSFLPEGVHYQKGKVIKAGFESAYTMADYANMYYQQRFSATENEWDAIQNTRRPTVENLIADLPGSDKDFWIERLHLRPLFPKTLLMLSSGELRRFLIATILIKKPEIVIFL
jgi:molybdate transport system ATP-binding protein